MKQNSKENSKPTTPANASSKAGLMPDKIQKKIARYYILPYPATLWAGLQNSKENSKISELKGYIAILFNVDKIQKKIAS